MGDSTNSPLHGVRSDLDVLEDGEGGGRDLHGATTGLQIGEDPGSPDRLRDLGRLEAAGCNRSIVWICLDAPRVGVQAMGEVQNVRLENVGIITSQKCLPMWGAEVTMDDK